MASIKIKQVNPKIADHVHKYDEARFREFDRDIQSYLTKNIPLSISHLDEKAQVANSYSRILDMSKGAEYKSRPNTFTRPLHWDSSSLC